MTADPEGYVFHDTNGNSTFDAGESAVGAGWTVYVDTNENGALDAGEINATTDTAGHYNILLPDGTYSIRVVPQSPFQDDRLPLGTAVRDFPSIEDGTAPGGDRYSGLAWVNDSLYVTFIGTNFDVNVMYQADPMTGVALGPAVAVPGLGTVAEITFDGTNFWGADYINDYLIQFSFAGQELRRLSFPGMDINSVEWDGANLRVHDHDAHRIYQIDPSGSGNILGYVNTPPELCVGLAFDGSHLWVSGTDTGTLYALNPETGAVERSFPHSGTFGFGLAVRGTNLWLSAHELSRVFQYDLGYGGGRIVTVAGADVTGVNLAVFQPGSISGRVFNDNNQNGAQDASDGGVAGWRVYVESDANGRYDLRETSAVTNALGNYTLSGLRPGTYMVVSDLAGQRLPRWSEVAPAGGTYSVALSSGGAVSGKNFANFLDRTTPIAASEWGTFQGGDMSLYTGLSWVNYGFASKFAGATTYVADSTYNGYLDWRLPTKTEAQTAAINGVAPRMGGYGSPPGTNGWWTSTTTNVKGGPGAWEVNLWDGSAGANSQIGAALVAGVRDTGLVIDDGAPGYTATGFSAKTTSGAYQGDQSTVSKGDGSKTATWTFSGLEVGATYKVDVTWKTANGAATNAPFKVINGTTTLATVPINQQVAPGDFSIADIGWKGLGTYTISNGTLKVQLSNAANGTVLADAVRIFKVLPSYAPAAPLTAAAGPATGGTAELLTDSQLRPIVREAVRRWNLTGLTPAERSLLRSVTFQLANLDGAALGNASGTTVTLDRNAAGYGWFVDRTPRSDAEFRRKGDQGEQNRMDLLTAVMHELGHVLGRPHADTGVMAEALTTGTRLHPGLDR